MKPVIILLILVCLSGCVTVQKPADCEDNHRPVPVIEVTQ